MSSTVTETDLKQEEIDLSNQEPYKQPEPSRRQAIQKKAYALFLRYWFLLGLAIVIGLAWAFPQVGKANGDIQAQYTVKWGAVIIIFLLSGLGLEVSVMLKTILRWRLHVVVQFINFILLPFLMYGIVRFFITVHADLDMTVYKGWMIALSTSTTVSSNAIMTRNANGNDGAALFNAALVLAPLVLGQLIRYLFPVRVKYLAAKFKFPIINSLALLCLVWSVFCDGVASDAFTKMTAVDIVAIIFVDIFMYLFGCAACLFVARLPWPLKEEPQWVTRWRFSKKDSVAIMYCGATKTVSMGIPLINVLYSSSSYGVVGVLSLPLLMYHICQLFIGNFQVPLLKRWIEADEEDSCSEATQDVIPLSTIRKRGN
ncbi:SBF-like CPA transporter family-domain-containing protein [Mucor mucedo]|uniref:SBF-like CPA transporter family-domain-containing protein n=1 Tax=Mucor mucedo TaxID=29922 RepID=UPI002220B3BF|nr:SBF-like CPA transporter family-domain-containing protein [Mucor mucedo]KAI7894800.1 SBF-like CPA transporter family-domain-containing protein [Mucor mucedo]